MSNRVIGFTVYVWLEFTESNQGSIKVLWTAVHVFTLLYIESCE